MSPCLNPDCETGDPAFSWLDHPGYCCLRCRDTHTPRPASVVDLRCAREACPVEPDTSVRNAMGGYCSKTCIALDTPAPVEAWAAAMGRPIDGGPIGASELIAPFPPPAGAVESLTPVPAGAESSQSVNDPQGPPWADISAVALSVTIFCAMRGVAYSRQTRMYGALRCMHLSQHSPDDATRFRAEAETWDRKAAQVERLCLIKRERRHDLWVDTSIPRRTA